MSRIDPDAAAEPAEPESPPPRAATIGVVVRAVASSFLGIRKGSAMQRDAVAIKLHQVILVGVALAVVFVIALVLVVQLVLRGAGA